MLTVVLPRTYPDLDGVACAIAYAELLGRKGTPAQAWFPTEGDTEAEFALKRSGGFTLAESGAFRPDTRFVLVDACDLDGFPAEVPTLQVVEVIDHRQHVDPRQFFPNAVIRIESVGAAATIIAEDFRAAQCIPTASSARLLYGAIHSNTQELKGSVTKDRDIAAAAWLESVGDIPQGFLDAQFESRRNDIVNDLEGFVLRESKDYSHPDGAFVIAQLEFRGAQALVANQADRLIKALEPLGSRAMLNMVDLLSGTSYLVIPDSRLREVVSQTFGKGTNGVTLEFQPSILRKQIVAALRL